MKTLKKHPSLSKACANPVLKPLKNPDPEPFLHQGKLVSAVSGGSGVSGISVNFWRILQDISSVINFDYFKQIIRHTHAIYLLGNYSAPFFSPQRTPRSPSSDHSLEKLCFRGIISLDHSLERLCYRGIISSDHSLERLCYQLNIISYSLERLYCQPQAGCLRYLPAGCLRYRPISNFHLPSSNFTGWKACATDHSPPRSPCPPWFLITGRKVCATDRRQDACATCRQDACATCRQDACATCRQDACATVQFPISTFQHPISQAGKPVLPTTHLRDLRVLRGF
jgi:hypothetical protein